MALYLIHAAISQNITIAGGWDCRFGYSHFSQEEKMRAVLIVLMFLAIEAGSAPGEGLAEVIRKGPGNCKAVALTFDMCPVREGSGYDEPLIRMLIEKQIPATFFVSGRWMAKHDAEVRALLAVPLFEVGTHGHVHAHLPELDDEQQRHEIMQPATHLRRKYGHNATLFRPPYGEYNELTIHLAEVFGLRFILWNVVSGDPDPHLSEAEIFKTVKSRVGSGSIVVMHANGKGRRTREVVADLYDELIVRQGYHPVTVSTLLDQCSFSSSHDRRSSDH